MSCTSREAKRWYRPLEKACPPIPAFHVAKITLAVAADVFPITGVWTSPLPSGNNLGLFSHQAVPPAPQCRRGVMSQATKGLEPGGSSHPCPSQQHRLTGTAQLQVSPSLHGSLLYSYPMETSAAPGEDSQHPTGLARESLKAVSNTNGSFTLAKMWHGVFAKAKETVLHAGLWALQPPVCRRVCV